MQVIAIQPHDAASRGILRRATLLVFTRAAEPLVATSGARAARGTLQRAKLDFIRAAEPLAATSGTRAVRGTIGFSGGSVVRFPIAKGAR